MYQAFGLQSAFEVQSAAKRSKFNTNCESRYTCTPRAKRMATKTSQSNMTFVATQVSTNQRSVFPHDMFMADHSSAIVRII